MGAAIPGHKKKVPALLAAYFPQTALCLNRLYTQGVGDFAATERDLLAALKHDGARLLEEQLNDSALPGPENPPQADEENYGPRPKVVLTCLGWITLRRPYFYSAARQAGRFPLDAALGLADSYSPGVARWMRTMLPPNRISRGKIIGFAMHSVSLKVNDREKAQ